MDTRFHCVYLLTSLDPQCIGDFYIGYTVNPLRRLRQHNGELVNGARRTSRRGRPWKIVCCVSGFTEDRIALKFEWCWQHPTLSARLKETVDILKGLRKLPYAVGTLHLIVRAPLFCKLDLTLHIFEVELLREATAKVELFLLQGAGGGSTVSTTGNGARQHSRPPFTPPLPPQPLREGVDEPIEEQQAGHADWPSSELSPLRSQGCQGGLLSNSIIHTAASADRALLPRLASSALFHVEVTSLQAFEDAYLRHDRCLRLPDTNMAAGRSLSGASESEACETSAISAPYDGSLLSQAARTEWMNASFASSSGEDASLSPVPKCWPHAASPHHTPSPHRSEASLTVLGGYSEARTGESVCRGRSREQSLKCTSSFGGEGDARRACSSPPFPQPTAEEFGRRSRSCQPFQPTMDDEASSTLVGRPCALQAREAAPETLRRPPRIPLRFASYTEADFAREYAEEQERLYRGLLPCTLCGLPLPPLCVMHCSRSPFCSLRCHVSCLAMWLLYAEAEDGVEVSATIGEGLQADSGLPQRLPPAVATTAPSLPSGRLIPTRPCPCPLCGVLLHWGSLVRELKRRVGVEQRLLAAQRHRQMERRWQERITRIGQTNKGPGWRRRKRARGETGSDGQTLHHTSGAEVGGGIQKEADIRG